MVLNCGGWEGEGGRADDGGGGGDDDDDMTRRKGRRSRKRNVKEGTMVLCSNGKRNIVRVCVIGRLERKFGTNYINNNNRS